ncbi:vomeronasal type-2 receptor 26-like [Python bivittatus]|uniref:Vomeronasal type-2 receptor 26-like n=1 Tax=Python bivittatus TaxID=176946 RepID=A0A9F5IY66_PYTBI|nr:vomeronasal type-2 receptor 26-like [Python bivittatus]
MVPNEILQYMGIISLLKYFGWTWIGLFAADDESGDRFLHSLDQLFSKNGICSAFVEKIPNQHNAYNLDGVNSVVSNIYQVFTESKGNVFVIYGEPLTILWLNTYVFLGFPGYKENASFGKVWIMTAQLDFTLTGLQNGWDFQLFQGAFSFTIHSNVIENFQKFVQTIKPGWNQGDGFLKDFWEQAFNCMFVDPQNTIRNNDTCTGDKMLKDLPGTLFEIHMTGHSYNIYNAVYAIAHASHDINQLRSKFKAVAGGKKLEHQDVQPWKFNQFLQEISFNNSVGETVSFNNQREIVGSGFDIMNMITFPNTSFQRVKVGRVDQDVLEGKEFIINEDIIVWHTDFKQMTPVSACNSDCFPSYQKKKKEGEKFCCFECVLCPDGKISTQKNVDDCFKCPEGQYPTQNRNQCIPKSISFLSYEEPLGIGLASVAGSSSLIIAFVLGIYIKHKDTPIVKANNQNLSFILLASLFLCFLSPFLFLGHPGKETCLLRQSAFVIIFSVAVSSVLAKTITVIIAFMATKPGSGIRKWMGKNLPICILLSCSFIQAGICIVWLATFPPFPDFDMQSMTENILAQCNEGFISMFYLALGYMGLLSIISFIVAFLARKLPDTFNEAKLITFSMLMFCSVWLSFVPTYLSTKGKYVVAVEIFSILASSAGLLSCIFFPKVYIILLKPELNVREHLTRRKRT